MFSSLTPKDTADGASQIPRSHCNKWLSHSLAHCCHTTQCSGKQGLTRWLKGLKFIQSDSRKATYNEKKNSSNPLPAPGFTVPWHPGSLANQLGMEIVSSNCPISLAVNSCLPRASPALEEREV